MEAAPPAGRESRPPADRLSPRWWQTRRFAILAAILSAAPLLWPAVPPLFDLPGHMGRYRVELAIGGQPWLRQWYDFRWSLIGNLGVDLLILPLAPVLGLELAVKLIVLTIPALTASGLLWIARELHGRIPPTALFALPLAYGYPFQFGFLNFALAMALALNGFALWLRLGRAGRLRLRMLVFVPASCLLWLCHIFGWAMFGVLAFSSEVFRYRDGGRGWPDACLRAAVACLPLALPIAPMIVSRLDGDTVGGFRGWLDVRSKCTSLFMVLRDRWMAFDVASAGLLYLLVLAGFRRRWLGFSREGGTAALLLFGMFLALPRVVFGSYYADMRLVPFAIALALVALRPAARLSARRTTALACAGIAFVALRLIGTTASYALYDRSYARELAALDHVPRGAAVVSFVGRHCDDGWANARLEHLPGMLLVRRLAYSNDQWAEAGAQLLTTRFAAADGYQHEPSQIVAELGCRGAWWRPAHPLKASQPSSGQPIRLVLERFPRDAFQYVWLIAPPPYDPALARGLAPVWRSGTSVLYRIDRDAASRPGGVRPSGAGPGTR